MRKIQNSAGDANQPIENQISTHSQERKTKDHDTSSPAAKELELSFLGSFAEFIKQQLSLLSNKNKGKTIAQENNKIFTYLSLFRKTLHTITQTDQSYNSEFIRNMSKLWDQIVTEHSYLKSMNKKNIPCFDKITFLIKNINSFPEKAEHSLGYYLTEYVGEKWLPFPFMHCMQMLYEEHQTNKSSSHLQKYLSILDGIFASLDVK
jgi:hypothetical protein